MNESISKKMSLTSDAPTDELLYELHLRQGRLGTKEELAEDYNTVCFLAHLINNRITAKTLVIAVAEIDIVQISSVRD